MTDQPTSDECIRQYHELFTLVLRCIYSMKVHEDGTGTVMAEPLDELLKYLDLPEPPPKPENDMAACDGKFAAEIPFDCIMEAIGIVRGGEIIAKKFELIRHLSWAAGCTAELLESRNVQASFGYDAAAQLNRSQCCDKLEAMAPAEGGEYGAIDWAAVLALVLRLIELIR